MKNAVRIAVMATVLAVQIAAAQSPPRGIEVTDVWARGSLDNARETTAYFEIVNHGDPDRLLGVTTPAADKAEVQETTWKGYNVTYVTLSALAVPASGRVTLHPGGIFVKLTGLNAPARPGQKIPLVLRFAAAGRVEIEAEVVNQRLGAP